MNINNPRLLTKEALEKAYNKYADSHYIKPKNSKGNLLIDQLYSIIPMEYNFESFSKKCNNNKQFYNKYR